jgi:hypothetical protein
MRRAEPIVVRQSEIYFDQAQQADRLAARVHNPVQQMQIREMAQAWRRMAFEAQAKEEARAAARNGPTAAHS